MNDARFIERWIERKRLKAAQDFATKNKADGNNQIITPFAPKINERSLWLRQRKSLVDIINEARPDIRPNIKKLADLNVDVDTIEKIVRYL
jgi:hypothetical protein